MGIKIPANIHDLYRVSEKAELVKGEIVLMSPTGGLPAYAGGEIFASLREYARRTRSGHAFPDNTGFVVDLPNRRSFSPDASFYTGEFSGGQFLQGAPVFAVEVRSEGDYGLAAEQAMADKRDEYFAAGTLVVWDVEVLREEIIRAYHGDTSAAPLLFLREDIANAEPVLLDWTFPVEDLFP